MDPKQWATTAEAAAYLGLRMPTMRQQRSRGIGPAYVRSGGRVFYRWQVLEEYARAEASRKALRIVEQERILSEARRMQRARAAMSA